MKATVVFIGQPFGIGGVCPDAVLAAAVYASERYATVYKHQFSSWLPSAFNLLWGAGLENGRRGSITHFAMLHSDIIPENGWVDYLIDECTRMDAHLVSAVVPLKDARGLTSTGREVDQWTVNRLSLKQVHELPHTFSSANIGGPLMVNSGCWVADMRKPEWYAVDAAGDSVFRFTGNDRIAWQGDKALVCQESEDWFFSRLMHAAGLRYFATRAVSLKHRGSADFSNSRAWGTCETDDEVPA